ncbi:MAG: Hvo_1808 family surface protein [Salinigranum sp.]
MSPLRALLVVGFLVLAGCTAPAIQNSPVSNAGGGGGGGGSAAESPVASHPPGNFTDPPKDVIGWEDGYWYDEPIHVNQSDGLSKKELHAFVGRAMARVEYIRHLEFKKSVPVNVISRAKYSAQTNANTSKQQGDFGAWNNQVWEALFITGESNDSQQAIGQTQSTAVAGFYSPRDDEIKIITNTPDHPVIDNATLVHELTHALQDQHFNLSRPSLSSPTQDGQLATDGIVEGGAQYVEKRYSKLCTSQWQCVAPPPSKGKGANGGSSSSGAPSINPGIYLTIYQPYSDGPAYVAALHRRGGWQAVNRKFANPPASTEQTIHVNDQRPVPINYTNTARDGWHLFPNQGVNGSDTVGEASIFTMFWYQSAKYHAGVVNPRSVFQASGPYDTYNYDSKPSAGWANDRVFPYRKAAGGGSQYGYVWVTRWDSPSDARQFQSAYRKILSAHDATQRTDGVYVIKNDPWADAFRVVRQGNRVVIVNGPTPAAVDSIRPGLASSTGGSRASLAPASAGAATDNRGQSGA